MGPCHYEEKTFTNIQTLYFHPSCNKHMHSPDLEQFISEHSHLFWYTPEHSKKEISLELLVENTLNYGSLDDFRQLVRLVGFVRVSDVFFSAAERKKMNYYPEIHHFYSLIFRKYAQRDF